MESAHLLCKKIIKSWGEGVSSMEIYYLLVDLVCAPSEEMCAELLGLKSELYHRMLIDDDPEDMVEDFVCDQRYRPLRDFLSL